MKPKKQARIWPRLIGVAVHLVLPFSYILRSVEKRLNCGARARRRASGRQRSTSRTRSKAPASKSNPPASKSGEIDEKTIENCAATMQMLNPGGGSLRDYRRACQNIGRRGPLW